LLDSLIEALGGEMALGSAEAPAPANTAAPFVANAGTSAAPKTAAVLPAYLEVDDGSPPF
jgi:hypothetical protein